MTSSKQTRLASIGMIIALTVLSGCGQAIREFNPGIGIESASNDTLPLTVDSYETDLPSEPTTSSSSSSSSMMVQQPGIIDIPTAFQQQFIDTGYGYEQSEAYADKSGTVRFLKINDAMRPHRQDWSSEVYYIVSGALTVTMGDMTSSARAGEMITVPPKTILTLTREGSAPVFLIQYLLPLPTSTSETQWFEFRPSTSSSSLSSLSSSFSSSL